MRAARPITDEEAVAAADKEMEERANRAKELLSRRYVGLKRQQEGKKTRKMQLERQMQGMGVSEDKKREMRKHLEQEEMMLQKHSRKTMSPADFDSLAVVGRGAFGEVRLVRDKKKGNEPVQIYALKSMKKEMMVLKNQVGHVRAEREALAKASAENRWLTALHYSFVDETHLYMVMEFCPGGDLMSMLIKEDTFSEHVTRFFMAEAAHAISSIHALGYIHRDIKPDNMLLDSRGHLKLTDMGLCKKVGEVSPMDDPEVVLQTLRDQGYIGKDAGLGDHPGMRGAGRNSGSRHRNSDDAMAMSIDDNMDMSGGSGTTFAAGQRQNPNYTAKARREVRLQIASDASWISDRLSCHSHVLSRFLFFFCSLDGVFNGWYTGLHCSRSFGGPKRSIRILVHYCSGLVEFGCHYV
mmetsp:Transcript_39196/g.94786  ORF Transcript_39196/g.94786 Transcript_39196/m.94786 type:complete len:410 (+) Transcript_39196:300-1529(+)